MTETKYNKLIEKIFWFCLPLIIGLLTYLVVNTFDVAKKVETVATRNEGVMALQEKMWAMIQENNRILTLKADQKENSDQHEIIMDKMDRLEINVDKLNSKIHAYKVMGESFEKPINDIVVAKPIDSTITFADNKKIEYLKNYLYGK